VAYGHIGGGRKVSHLSHIVNKTNRVRTILWVSE